MAFVPFVLFVVVWIFTYKHFISKQKGKFISHFLGFIISFLVFTVSIIIIAPQTNNQQSTLKEENAQDDKITEEKKVEQYKAKELKKLNDALNISLKEASRMTLEDLEQLAIAFAKNKNIEEKYYQKIYSCFGNFIWSKEKTLPLSTIAEWCYNDTKKENYANQDYINKATFMVDFSQWDGSYQPFVDLIKSSMNNPKSYEHVETRYSFVEDKYTPYMKIFCTFRGTNAFNAIVTQTISAKVDENTKKIYDIK